jgi:ankyrin repeat protein
MKGTKRRIKRNNKRKTKTKKKRNIGNKRYKRRDGKGLKELIEASIVGNVEAVRAQLNTEDNIINARYNDRRREFGSTALHVACRNNKVDVIRVLLENGADPNSVDDFGQTPLIELMLMENDGNVSAAIELLLEHGADINAKDDEDTTALMYACLSKNKNAVDVLLENRADIHLRDNTGKTALQIAQDKGNADIVEAIEAAIVEEEHVPILK